MNLFDLNHNQAFVAKNKADEFGFDLYEIFRQVQHRAVVSTINGGNPGDEALYRGLWRWHAYSLLQIDEVKLEDGSSERLGKELNVRSLIFFSENP